RLGKKGQNVGRSIGTRIGGVSRSIERRALRGGVAGWSAHRKRRRRRRGEAVPARWNPAAPGCSHPPLPAKLVGTRGVPARRRNVGGRLPGGHSSLARAVLPRACREGKNGE